MPHPVEIDVAVGEHGQRAAFHLELMAQVDPHDFVDTVYNAVLAALYPQSAGDGAEMPVDGDACDPQGEAVSDGDVETAQERWARMEARRRQRMMERLKNRGVA